jgi:glutathione S-transferase
MPALFSPAADGNRDGMIDYISVEEACGRDDIRLVLTAGVPGPWGEAAKAILGVKGIEFIPVRQSGGGRNEALAEWTGQTSAPVLIVPGEAPHLTLRAILLAAERLAPEPGLVPKGTEERATFLGLCGEIHAELGFGWCRRLLIFDPILSAVPAGDPAIEELERMAKKYGYYPGCSETARERVIEILAAFSERLRRQQATGRDFLYGDSLTALDLIFAVFSNLVVPLDADDCPMPDFLRATYAVDDAGILAAVAPALIEHRDRILRDHVGLPMRF